MKTEMTRMTGFAIISKCIITRSGYQLISKTQFSVRTIKPAFSLPSPTLLPSSQFTTLFLPRSYPFTTPFSSPHSPPGIWTHDRIAILVPPITFAFCYPGLLLLLLLLSPYRRIYVALLSHFAQGFAGPSTTCAGSQSNLHVPHKPLNIRQLLLNTVRAKLGR